MQRTALHGVHLIDYILWSSLLEGKLQGTINSRRSFALGLWFDQYTERDYKFICRNFNCFRVGGRGGHKHWINLGELTSLLLLLLIRIARRLVELELRNLFRATPSEKGPSSNCSTIYSHHKIVKGRPKKCTEHVVVLNMVRKIESWKRSWKLLFTSSDCCCRVWPTLYAIIITAHTHNINYRTNLPECVKYFHQFSETQE